MEDCDIPPFDTVDLGAKELPVYIPLDVIMGR